MLVVGSIIIFCLFQGAFSCACRETQARQNVSMALFSFLSCRQNSPGMQVLFEEGLVLTEGADGTFTHHVLKFLRSTKILYFQDSALVLEGRDAKMTERMLYEPLQRVRLLVRTMRQMAGSLRPTCSWERRFVAYRLPPHPDQRAYLQAIWQHAGMDAEEVWQQWEKLTAVAMARHSAGASIQDSWAQASADFPEWKLAREAVSLFLAFSASSAITERTLKELSKQETSERARMLNSAEEDILLACQAPSEEAIAHRTKDAVGNRSLRPKNKYLPLLLKDYVNTFGMRISHKAPKKRRDRGLRKDPDILQQQRLARGGVVPEADTRPSI